MFLFISNVPLSTPLDVSKQDTETVRHKEHAKSNRFIDSRPAIWRLFIYLPISTHLPGAALPPETRVVSGLTLTAFPASGSF